MTISNQIYSFCTKHNRAITIALGILVAALIGGYGYYWYKTRLEYNAQRDFAESAEDYYKLFASAKAGKAWHDVEQGLAYRAEQNKNSTLAPYFLVYQADALLQEGKTAQALTILNNALSQLPKSSPIYYLYSIKRALIKLDSEQEAERAQGVSELDKLSTEKDNPYQDMASYYRGYHAWNIGSKAEARQIWSQMSKFAQQGSPWAQLAFVKLQGIA